MRKQIKAFPGTTDVRDAALEPACVEICHSGGTSPETHSQPFVILSPAYACAQLSVCCLDDGFHLHNGSVLPDPLVERGGKLFKLLKLFLRLRVKERVARWRF